MKNISKLFAVVVIISTIILLVLIYISVGQFNDKVNVDYITDDIVSYGQTSTVVKGDLEEVVNATLSKHATNFYYEECISCLSSDYELYVSEGQVINKGELFLESNSLSFYAKHNGRLEEVIVGENSVKFKFADYDNPSYQIALSDSEVKIDSILNIIYDKQTYEVIVENLPLDENQNGYLISFKSDVIPPKFPVNGSLNVEVKTGVNTTGATLIDNSCIYNYNDSKYARIIDDEGIVIGEIKLELGIVGSLETQVFNLDEGDICDIDFAISKDDGTDDIKKEKMEVNDEYIES